MSIRRWHECAEQHLGAVVWRPLKPQWAAFVRQPVVSRHVVVPIKAEFAGHLSDRALIMSSPMIGYAARRDAIAH